MRTEDEVRAEIDWRQKEIKEIKQRLTNIDEDQIEYLQYRIQNLTMAIEWCKWFLKE